MRKWFAQSTPAFFTFVQVSGMWAMSFVTLSLKATELSQIINSYVVEYNCSFLCVFDHVPFYVVIEHLPRLLLLEFPWEHCSDRSFAGSDDASFKKGVTNVNLLNRDKLYSTKYKNGTSCHNITL